MKGHRQTRGHATDKDMRALGTVARDPDHGARPGRCDGDNQERGSRQAHLGHVDFDPAARVQHLGVNHASGCNLRTFPNRLCAGQINVTPGRVPGLPKHPGRSQPPAPVMQAPSAGRQSWNGRWRRQVALSLIFGSDHYGFQAEYAGDYTLRVPAEGTGTWTEWFVGTRVTPDGDLADVFLNSRLRKDVPGVAGSAVELGGVTLIRRDTRAVETLRHLMAWHLTPLAPVGRTCGNDRQSLMARRAVRPQAPGRTGRPRSSQIRCTSSQSGAVSA